MNRNNIKPNDKYRKYNRDMALELVINPARERRLDVHKMIAEAVKDGDQDRLEGLQSMIVNEEQAAAKEEEFLLRMCADAELCDSEGYYFEMYKYYDDRISDNEKVIASMEKMFADNADSEQMTFEAVKTIQDEVTKRKRFINADKKRKREWKKQIDVLRVVGQFGKQGTGEQ